MDENQRLRIIKRHSHSIWLYGHCPQALYWKGSEGQELRFDILLECGVKSGDTVLDVGCGFADLYHYMKKKGLEVDYTGIDLSPDVLAAAKGKGPSLNFFEGDLFDLDPADQSFDWVFLSGSLNEPLKDNGAYVQAILPRMYASCTKGMAFNMLNSEYAWSEQQLHTLQPYDPTEIMAQLNKLSPHTQIRKDYLEDDATFFVWRDKQG